MKTNYSACNLILFLLVVLAVLFFGCEKKEPACPEAIVLESGRTYTPADFGGDSTVSGCEENPRLTWKKLVSYKVEYKRHVAMMDSICGDKLPCGGSLGFAETYPNHHTRKPEHVQDLWHKNILITIP